MSTLSLLNLSKDVISLIIERYLDIRSIVNIERVCKYFQEISLNRKYVNGYMPISLFKKYSKLIKHDGYFYVDDDTNQYHEQIFTSNISKNLFPSLNPKFGIKEMELVAVPKGLKNVKFQLRGHASYFDVINLASKYQDINIEANISEIPDENEDGDENENENEDEDEDENDDEDEKVSRIIGFIKINRSDKTIVDIDYQLGARITRKIIYHAATQLGADIHIISKVRSSIVCWTKDLSINSITYIIEEDYEIFTLDNLKYIKENVIREPKVKSLKIVSYDGRSIKFFKEIITSYNKLNYDERVKDIEIIVRTKSYKVTWKRFNGKIKRFLESV